MKNLWPVFLLVSFFFPRSALSQCWDLRSPVPGGVEFSDAFFLDAQTAWMVGRYGQILKSTNGGGAWTEQSSGVNADLKGIFFANSLQGWAVGANGLILKTNNGGASWQPRSSGTTRQLNGVYFLNNLAGWVVGHGGVVLKTTDGGESWIAQNSRVTTDLYAVQFLNTQEGWISGASLFVLKTANGGDLWNWQRVRPGASQILHDIQFISSQKGWTVGESETIFYTNNGGSTWNEFDRPPSFRAFKDVHFINANTGWIFGEFGIILLSNDGGATWTEQTSNTTSDLIAGFFSNSQTGRAVGLFGSSLQTSNGGTAWSNVYQDRDGWIRDIFFIDAQTGWAVGANGIILKTTDGGASWAPQVSGTTTNLGAVYFSNTQNGIALGASELFRSANGGLSWTRENALPTSRLSDAHFLNAQTFWIIEDGHVYKTNDGGANWTDQSFRGGYSGNYSEIQFVDDQNGWITVINYTFGLARTRDGGASWQTLSSGDLVGISFIDPQNGWGAAQNGVIRKTTDGGDTWVNQNSGTRVWLLDVHFENDQVGWAVGDKGTIVKTTDGGVTWIPQTSGANSLLSRIYSSAENKLWAVGDNGAILRQNATVPVCDVPVTSPADGAADVPVQTRIAWEDPIECIDGYRLSIGTRPGAKDILDNRDVGNTTSYALTDSLGAPLPFETTFYVAIAPYNHLGVGGSCTEYTFTTIPMPCRIRDSLFLVELFNATNGPAWNTPWDLQQSMDTWTGVILDNEECLVSLDLNGNNLRGLIPESIGTLASLANLILKDNQLTGSIPPGIGQLSNLTYLDLSQNQLTGDIPPELGDLPQLTGMILGENDLSGVIPASFGKLTSLSNLVLNGNALKSPIPPELAQLTSLTNIFLFDNQFDGLLPLFFAEMGLQFLILDGNQFSGCFPPAYASLCGATVNFWNNPGLPGGGDFPAFCADGSGSFVKKEIEEMICQGDAFQLGNNAYTTPGTYEETFSGSMNCDSIVVLKLIVNPVYDIQLAETICAGEAVQVGAKSYSTTGRHVTTLQSVHGCDSTVTLNLTVRPVEETFLAETICEGETYRVGNENYGDPGTFVATLQSSLGCDSIVTLKLTVVADRPQTGGDQQVCDPNANLIAVRPALATGRWTSLNNDAIISDPNSPQTAVFELSPGENRFLWTLSHPACPNYDSEEIVIFYQDEGVFTKDDEFTFNYKAGEPVTGNVLRNDSYPEPIAIELISGPEGLTLNSNGDFFINLEQYFPRLEFAYKIYYSGCPQYQALADATVFLVDGVGDTPRVITPNGDGQNDEFFVPELRTNPEDYPENELVVFNRWGQLVFKARPYNNDWDGSLMGSGKPLPSDTYFYILRLSLGNGEIRYGEITIIR